MPLRFRRNRTRTPNLTMTTTMPIAPLAASAPTQVAAVPAGAAPAPAMPIAPQAAVMAAAPVDEPVMPVMATRPLPGPAGLNGHRQLPLKTQATGNDVRAERLFRQVRTEMEELRSSFSNLRVAGEEMTELDIVSVCENPDAAAALPPALLVRALISSHQSSEKLLRKLARARARNQRLSEKLRTLSQEQAYVRGRTETLDQVIAALHGNLEDLRAARDGERALSEPAQPRALRGGSMAPPHEALPSAERA